MVAKINLIGKKFHRLEVIGKAESDSGGRARWLCKCDCGNEKIITSAHLRRGSAKSCGCLRDEVNRKRNGTHLMSKSPTYKTWRAMRTRCENKKDPNYERYGAKGVTICERWSKFENFLDDMGERPEGKTIDRIDGSKGYELSNCRWATINEQNNNQSKNNRVTIGNKTMTLAEWARFLDVDYLRTNTRVHAGWHPVDALLTPLNTEPVTKLGGFI